MRRKNGRGPAPITLAVTGHRDVLDGDRIRAAIRTIIEEYRGRYPHSPLRMLTMLAAGADGIAAEAALDAGIELVGLLPMDMDMYVADFAAEGDRAGFERLYAACSERYAMPLPPGVAREAASAPGPARDRCYAYGGAFLVRQASALIAVWDGTDPGLRGGTADIVKAQLCATGNDFFRQADFLGGRQTGPVHWIYARRAKHPDAPIEAPSALPFDCVRLAAGDGSVCETLFPAGWKFGGRKDRDSTAWEGARRYYEGFLGSIDEFNEDALGLPDLGGAAVYSVADTLAMRFQKRSRRALVLLIVLGTATFAQMVVFDERLQSAFTLFSFFSSLAATWMVYRLLRRSKWDGKYYDYRSLAELSRVVESLNGIGIRADPIDLTTLKQQGLLGWVSMVVRTASMPSFFSPSTRKSEDCERLMADWVDNQAEYYGRGIEIRERSIRWRKAIRFSLFAGAIAAAIGFFAVKLAASRKGVDEDVWWDFRGIKGIAEKGFRDVPPKVDPERISPYADVASWLQVAFDVLLSSGAAFALFMDMRAFEDEIRLFERSAVVFRRASSLMRTALRKDDLDAFASLALELGREAIAENFEWNDDHRNIPLEMPMG